MSSQLLFDLNSESRSGLYDIVATFDGELRTAWYPSAGHDGSRDGG